MNALRNICIFYIFAWQSLPPLRFHLPFRILFVCCFVLFLAASYQHIIRKMKFLIVPLLTFVVVVLVSCLRYSLHSCYSTLLAGFIFLASMTIFSFYLDVGFARFYKTARMLILSFVVFNLTTLYSLARNPLLCRQLGNSSTEWEYVNVSNTDILITGGFNYIYIAVLLTPILMPLIFNSEVDRWDRGLFFIYCVTSFFMVLSAMYSTAVILLLLGVGLAFFIRKLSFLTLSAILAMGTVLFVSLKNVIYKVLLYFAGDNFSYTSKIEAVFNPTKSEDAFTGRLGVWSESMNSFFSNPIIGGGVSGGHSTILDTLGMYGVFVGVGYLGMIFFPVLVWRKPLSLVNRQGIVVLFVLLLFLVTLLNPLQFSYSVVVFGIFPCVCVYYYLNPSKCLMGYDRGNSSCWRVQVPR